jgi:hypothetical protein
LKIINTVLCLVLEKLMRCWLAIDLWTLPHHSSTPFTLHKTLQPKLHLILGTIASNKQWT